MHNGWFSGIVSAPLATALGALSLGITVVIVLSIGDGGRLSTAGTVGLLSAVVLAILATGQAARPAKPDGDGDAAAPSSDWPSDHPDALSEQDQG